MTEKIININEEELSAFTLFHFAHSLRPFILVRFGLHEDYLNQSWLFIDLNYDEALRLEDLETEGLEFYTREDDENFLGVAIFGEITY